MTLKAVALIALPAVLIGTVLFVDPIPQDPAYHLFADTRSMLGIPNFWNVASNIPFLLVGGSAMYYLRPAKAPAILSELSAAYQVFFAGIFLTGIGSAYYHWAPGNDTLVWDRLPMTIGFMGLFTIIIGEHVSVSSARYLLIPLLIAGASSVFYWAVTEARGAGDLRPYAIVQFLPMLLIPLILLTFRSAFDSVAALWAAVILYALSKPPEFFDARIYAFGELVSGHTIKHLIAAAAPLALLAGIRGRRLARDLAAGG